MGDLFSLENGADKGRQNEQGAWSEAECHMRNARHDDGLITPSLDIGFISAR